MNSDARYQSKRVNYEQVFGILLMNQPFGR